MVFCLVLYLHERFKVFIYYAGQKLLLRPFLQLCILAIYWWSVLTRVSDYVHHPVDVLAGLLLSTCVALWSWTHLIELLKDIDQTNKTLINFSMYYIIESKTPAIYHFYMLPTLKFVFL